MTGVTYINSIYSPYIIIIIIIIITFNLFFNCLILFALLHPKCFSPG